MRTFTCQFAIEAGSIEFWHAEITQDQVVRPRPQLVESLTAIGHRIQDMPVAAEHAHLGCRRADFVVDNEKVLSANRSDDVGLRRLDRGGEGFRDGKLNPENGALSRLALDIQPTAMARPRKVKLLPLQSSTVVCSCGV